MQNKSPNNIIGPDINEYRGAVDYNLLATKTPYCYLRASGSGSGRFRVDKNFFTYVKGLKSVGILSGAYHYAVPSYDLTTADSQCDSFIEVLQQAYGTKNFGELMPVIDIETPLDKSISTDALLDWVDRFRNRFVRKTRRVLMLYTGAFFIEMYNNFYHSKKGYILSNMPLWIAMYPERPSNPPYPKDQGGWKSWTMWQFTENGVMSGINPPVDLNYGPTNLDYLTQPRDVKNLKTYLGDNRIYISWNKNTDIDLNGYNIFLNGEYVATVNKNTTNYTLKLTTPYKAGNTYIIGIDAFDTMGNSSQNRAKAYIGPKKDFTEEYNKCEYRNKDVNYLDKEDDFYYYPIKSAYNFLELDVTFRDNNYFSNQLEIKPVFKYKLEEENYEFDEFTFERSYDDDEYDEVLSRKQNNYLRNLDKDLIEDFTINNTNINEDNENKNEEDSFKENRIENIEKNLNMEREKENIDDEKLEESLYEENYEVLKDYSRKEVNLDKEYADNNSTEIEQLEYYEEKYNKYNDDIPRQKLYNKLRSNFYDGDVKYNSLKHKYKDYELLERKNKNKKHKKKHHKKNK